MKLNQQTAALALCTLLGVFVLAGCGRSGDFSELQPAVNKIEYTNLNDSGSRELLKELLSDTGVSDGRIQSFFRRVDLSLIHIYVASAFCRHNGYSSWIC